jgi:hypothetical protein
MCMCHMRAKYDASDAHVQGTESVAPHLRITTEARRTLRPLSQRQLHLTRSKVGLALRGSGAPPRAHACAPLCSMQARDTGLKVP